MNPKRTAFVTGWGDTSFGGQNSPALLEIMIPLVEDDTCTSVMSGRRDDALRVNTITELCAGSVGRDSCQGDSGGPLVVQRNKKYRQIGIVSYGIGCGVTFGVYTRVSHYVDWIEGIINN